MRFRYEGIGLVCIFVTFSVTTLAVGNMKCEMSSCSSEMGLTLAKSATDQRYCKLLYSVCFVFKCIYNYITLTDCQFYCFSAFYPTKWVLCCLRCCQCMMSLVDKIYYLALLCFCRCINFSGHGMFGQKVTPAILLKLELNARACDIRWFMLLCILHQVLQESKCSLQIYCH